MVLLGRRIGNCYMDISLPERINDYTYFVADEDIRQKYTHEVNGDVIPAIAIDCFGDYELFYSKIAPEVGIEVLRRGLGIGNRKACIAQDLGYIYSDEHRYREAAEMFQIAADEGVSSYFVYDELASAYLQIGELEKARKYKQLYNRAAPGGNAI